MGGALPIHITMWLYARDEIKSNNFEHIDEKCLTDETYIFEMDDIQLMKYSHMCCISLLFIQMLLDLSHRNNYFKT